MPKNLKYNLDYCSFNRNFAIEIQKREDFRAKDWR